MKITVIVLLVTLGFVNLHAQETIAKFKYEDAEKAFYEEKYEDCISLLDETEKLLGQTAPNILHLKIVAQYKLFEKNPHASYEALEALRNNCNAYLTNFDIAGLEEKYRDVYDIQNNLPATTRQEYEQIESERVAKREKADQLANVLNLVFVEGGSFEMGDGSDKDNPRHEVTLSDFYIGKYEVTIGKFEEFLRETQYVPSAKKMDSYFRHIKKGKWLRKSNLDWSYSAIGAKYKIPIEEYPVAYINYTDAVAFCQWLSDKYNVTFRLPTEAEWEYAARGGQESKGYKYAGSNDASQVSWNLDNTKGGARYVGGKAPNELGLYDMTGNVWEICLDWYDKEYYKNSPVHNPLGPATGMYRVMRGSSALASAKGLKTVFNRLGDKLIHPESNVGFRYILVIE